MALHLLLALLAFLFLHIAPGQDKPAAPPKPEIKGLSLLGIFRGKTTLLTVYGENLVPQRFTAEKESIVVTVRGAVEATAGDEKKRANQKLMLEVTVPADCPPDVYDLTLTPPGGEKVSTRLAVWEPTQTELETKRPCRAFAQAMPLSGTFLGVTTALPEDETPDLYRFEAAEGQTWQITVYASDSGSPLDALVRLRDARRVPLALAGGLNKKPRELTFHARRAGTYYIEVGDANGRSGPTFTYRLVLHRLDHG